MKIEVNGNAAIVFLDRGEGFYFKKNILTGYPHFEWCLFPPFPFGSPIMRLLNKSYFGLRKVLCNNGTREVPVTGYHRRGNFYSLTIPSGQNSYVSARHLVGFSRSTKKITTHIKLHPVFWCLREQFFTVVEGPSTVLLYSPSAFVERNDNVFETRRIISFDIKRRITASTVQPTTWYSHFRNLVDKTVYLKFLDDGTTLAEAHHDGENTEFSVRELFVHILGFLKF